MQSRTSSTPSAALWPLLRRCYGYWRASRREVLGAYALVLVINALNVTVPQFIRWTIDQGIEQRQLTLLTWAVLGLLGLTLGKGILIFIQGRWLEIASQQVAYVLRNGLLSRLSQLSFAYHDRAETGQLLSRIVQDAERIRFLTGRATWRLVDGLFLLAATMAALLWMNWRLALVALLIVPLLLHRGYHYGRRFRPLAMAIQDQLGVLTTRIEQNLRGARIVKAFAQESAETARFREDNEEWFDLAADSARLQAINGPLLDFIANAGTVVVIWYGGLLVIRDQVTLGELVAFTTYLAQLYNPLRILGRIIPILAIAGSSAERIFEVLDAPSPVENRPDAQPIPHSRGHVRFEDVSFTYPGRDHVLADLNFEARPGQVVALLGATGSGKSTVVNLLPRFYDPTSGRITLDGRDLSDYTIESLRRQIGIVAQESTLFAATIRENIAFGRPDASQEEIEAAARAAQAHHFIGEQLPNGYDTMVGERGITLSGGQKQRLAIARALLTDPRILILDDATASVDAETEKLIQQALQTLMEGRTTFVIAHRLSTIRRADLILLLDRGRIVARGRHEELLERSPRYAQVYEMQTMEMER